MECPIICESVAYIFAKLSDSRDDIFTFEFIQKHDQKRKIFVRY